MTYSFDNYGRKTVFLYWKGLFLLLRLIQDFGIKAEIFFTQVRFS
jgi:hypothetical protein